jgi:hypothetical protein
LLFQTLNMSDDPSKSVGDVAMFVNEHLWRLLNPKTPIYFKAQQTPLLYDSMSAISFGFASCTGLSILYLDALRSVGVPARLVGTPAWHGKYKDGNHNWVPGWFQQHSCGLTSEDGKRFPASIVGYFAVLW